MALDAAQRGVARGMAAGAGVSALLLGAGWWLAPPLLPASADLAQRLAFALRCDLVLLLWLLVAIGAVAKGRFHSPRDIAGSGFGAASPAIAVPAAVLQNTLEQVVLALPAHLALATSLPPRQLWLVPALVLLFSLGRAAFWRGYARGAAARAFGFACTFYPSIFAVVLAAALAIS